VHELDRIVIDGVRPRTPTGRYPAKALIAEPTTVSATIFKDGHDLLAARVCWRPAATNARTKAKTWAEAAMTVANAGLDLWAATIEPVQLGLHEVYVEAWYDEWATVKHKLKAKLDAGQEVDVELEEAARLVERRAEETGQPQRQHLDTVTRTLRDDVITPAERYAAIVGPTMDALMAGPMRPEYVTRSDPQPLWVDRTRAQFGAWYELFPRSYGGLRGVIERLPAIADMGFDVVYLTPIHPTGSTFKKGRNNTQPALPGDVGSVYAIGGPDGGHTDIDPGVGTFDDFAALVAAANELGMEIALDNALQCSPDHPWVKEHLEWFHHRPDGSIAYAENPPKRYQDIYPLNFWPAKDEDRQALWDACRHIFEFWVDKGVRVFRVDNPHTKPVAFWAWVIPQIQAQNPDVVFLAEAFTRPAVMAKLAEIGFSQSYTYFTWRTTKLELTEYVEEIAHSYKADFMRPNFWPNTHDILSGPLRNGPLPAFKSRLVLAATLVPSYGIYSGYELLENEPMSDANEDYMDSEKYEVKERDWDAPHSIAPFITLINTIRNRHPALQHLRNIQFHHADNEQILVYSKVDTDHDDALLVVVNLDPRHTQEATLGLDLAALGIPWDRTYEAYDEITGNTFTWHGTNPYVRLDPWHQPAHILHMHTVGT
jgi:starch synthase (maltosyl-transferring)